MTFLLLYYFVLQLVYLEIAPNTTFKSCYTSLYWKIKPFLY